MFSELFLYFVICKLQIIKSEMTFCLQSFVAGGSTVGIL